MPVERSGPCVGCGQSISYYHDYCSKCEAKQSHREEIIEERTEIIEKRIEVAKKEGWVLNRFHHPVCFKHKIGNPGSFPGGYFSGLAEDLEDGKYYTLECYHKDCDRIEELELPNIEED